MATELIIAPEARQDNDFFDGIRTILWAARQKAYTSVNFIMVEAYWKIGQRIVEEEQQGRQRADYGDFLIRELSRLLGDEFGKGFSLDNFFNFKQFYLTFQDSEKLYSLRRELSWTHYRLIMRVETRMQGNATSGKPPNRGGDNYYDKWAANHKNDSYFR